MNLSVKVIAIDPSFPNDENRWVKCGYVLTEALVSIAPQLNRDDHFEVDNDSRFSEWGPRSLFRLIRKRYDTHLNQYDNYTAVNVTLRLYVADVTPRAEGNPYR